MLTTEAMQATAEMDAQLVAKRLEGNRDAFREIVERHQSLICALALSFTLAVLGALPLVSTTAKAAVAAAAAKGTASTKGGAAMAMLGAIVTGGIICYFSLAAFVTLLGAGLGYVMSRASERSIHQREYVARFWRILALGLPALTLASSWCVYTRSFGTPGHLAVEIGMSLSMGLTLLLTVLAFGIWTRRWRRGLGHPEPGENSNGGTAHRRFVLWIVLAMASLAPAFCLSHAELWDTSTWTKKRLSAAEARQLIQERKDARIHVGDSQQGWKHLSIVVPKDKITYVLLADEEMLAFLKTSGVSYHTYQEDLNTKSRLLAMFMWMMPLVGLIAVCLEPAGAVLLLRRPGKQPSLSAGLASQQSQKIEKRIIKVFASVLGLALATLILALLTLTPWGLRPVSRADSPQLIQLYRDAAEFHVVQRSAGASELWITLRNRIGLLRGPDFVIPVDESLRAFLAEQGIQYQSMVQGRDFGYTWPKKWVALTGSNKNIPYETMLQGRDFGYGEPTRAAALGWAFCLIAGAAGILWWANRQLAKSKQHRLANP